MYIDGTKKATHFRLHLSKSEGKAENYFTPQTNRDR